MFGKLLKAVVGTVVELPVAVVADAVTLGGTLTDKPQAYTSKTVGKIVKNVQQATE